jgi:hypothetical protein
VDALFDAALELPPSARAVLAEKLLDSLAEREEPETDEPDVAPDEVVVRSWRRE